MSEQVKIGFIGFGNYAKRAYYSFLSNNNPQANISVISCDLSSKENGLKFINSIPFVFEFEKTLELFSLDLIVVSTPHALHNKHVKFALEHGINVLVDKPLACNPKEAEELVRISRTNNLFLSVGLERRFESLYLQVKELIADKFLGDIKSISCEYVRPLDDGFESSWRNDPSLSGGGILLDAGIHIIDTLHWLVDLKVKSIGGHIEYGQYKVEKACSVSCEFEADIIGDFFFTYDAPGNFRKEEIWFFGSKRNLGIINYNQQGTIYEPKLIFLPSTMSGSIKTSDFTVTKEESKSKPLEDIIEAILNKKSFSFDVKSHLKAIEFIDLFYSSVGKNKF